MIPRELIQSQVYRNRKPFQSVYQGCGADEQAGSAQRWRCGTVRAGTTKLQVPSLSYSDKRWTLLGLCELPLIREKKRHPHSHPATYHFSPSFSNLFAIAGATSNRNFDCF